MPKGDLRHYYLAIRDGVSILTVCIICTSVIVFVLASLRSPISPKTSYELLDMGSMCVNPAFSMSLSELS